ncbi:DEAD/DEAH box helicase [Fibrella sp. WM1]|uniref:DEAD/DEAH box helicase n=1 Tax=Fibrella musci TaxID=3242485 RepID=UPI0035225B7F
MQFSATVLKTYRRRLTNLSSRNRSLLLSSLPADQFVDLHEADFRLNKASFDLIAALIARKANVPVCAITDPRDERSNTLSKRLRRLQRTDAFIEAERGTEDLYVGWPFVRGRFNDGTPVHGPLLFFPVHLATEGNQWRLVRRGDENAVINQSMLLAYGYFNGIKLPDDWLSPDLDSFDKDPLVFRTQLYEWLKASPLDINFNPDTFTNTLLPFDRQTAKSITELDGVGELKLLSEAVLGIFPQAGSFLVPDYDELLSEPPSRRTAPGPLLPEEGEQELILTSPPPWEGGGRGAIPALLPLPIDASQETAVLAVRSGQSVVVQGPPGTGKSQLIANLMADAAARGQRVLLVCQKRAALDVVHQRLTDVGMAPFVALVHDFQDDRKPLYAQLADQIDAIDAYRAQNRSLDAVLLEREFATESRRIDGLVRELQAFKTALFDTSVCGVSAKELYLTSTPQTEADATDLSAVYRHFQFDTVADFRDRLTNYLAYQQRLSDEHPFADRVSFAHFTGTDIASLRQIITEAATYLPTFVQHAGTLLGEPAPGTWLTWPDVIDRYVPERATLDMLAATVSDPLVWSVLSRVAAGSLPDSPTDTLANDLAALAAIEARGLLVGDAPNGLSDRLRQGIDARQSMVKWLFYSDKAYLNELAQTNGLGTSLADLRTLESRWVNRQSWEARAQETGQQFAGTSWSGTPDMNHQPAQTKQMLGTLQQTVARAESVWQTIRSTFPELEGVIAQQLSGGSFGQVLTGLRQLLDEMHLSHLRWQTYLTASQLTALAANPTEQANALQTALRTDADNLIEMDRLRDTFTTPERTVADQVRSVAAFDNALRLAWIDHLEQLHPELRSVSSLKMEQQEAALQHSIRRQQQLTRDILLLKLREQTYRDLVINRLNNVVSFRELRHQVTKKRNVWPIRQVMSQYADEVFRLMPCWMASPESVSTLFPMERGLFDLVIFDEASQCFAENGLPALLRGKQAVVAGDSRQLRPSDLYRARIEDDATNADTADEAVALEVESLLDLTAQYLPQVSLMGHYRSRSLDLIAFSNAHFYNETLTLLPDFAEANRREPGIRYLHVPGQWQPTDRTNPVEAQAVLSLVSQLQTELPGRSIGVVTFNFQQQQLIQELGQEQSEALPTAVRFVKNIENVQGDECDVIIFSVGYAPDERGRLSAQFGSLNAGGGENRLNVAITRARERIYVITSLLPAQLNVDATANDGPKLLKQYLHYALDVSEGRFRPQPKRVVGLQASSGTLLKDKLAQAHANWRPELPFADLTIHGDEPVVYEGLVLTDDDQYFQQTIKEAHAYRPFALQNRHWPYRRFWSREMWRQA